MPSFERFKQLLAFAQGFNVRLDVYLAAHWPEYSRSSWQKYVKEGYVSINGLVEKSVKKLLEEDDVVTVQIPKKMSYSDRTLPVIYKDSNVIVINKPSGLLTHSKGALNDEFTVGEYFKPFSSYKQETNRPGIVHRLDRDTSGVLIGVLNENTARLLQKQFSDRKVHKTYVAVVDGVPNISKAVIDLPIGRNPKKPSQFRIDPNGKQAQTQYEVLSSNGKLSLVELRPVTGRTHQLRVHMAHIGTPIHGDRIYGGKQADRLYLHAASLEITIPDGQRKLFSAEIPKCFLEINKL